MVYKNTKKGQQGIGTLVIFISLILVAAVAAGVLISTAGKLQGKAENTGDSVQQRLATGFTVIQIGASNTSDGWINKTQDSFEIRARLSPGSDAIKLKDITMTLVTAEGSSAYSYNKTTMNASQFIATSVSGDISDGYIKGSDVVTFAFNSSATIGESENFELTLFPGAGNAQRILLLTPPSMVNQYTILK